MTKTFGFTYRISMESLIGLIGMLFFAAILWLSIVFFGKIYSSSASTKREPALRQNEGPNQLREFINLQNDKPLFPEHSKASKEIRDDRHIPAPPISTPPKPQQSISKYKLKAEMDQKKLDAYFDNLTIETANIAYMRYVGYLFEVKGYTVNYYGIRKGITDSSIDLIVHDEFETIFVKCAYRPKEKIVSERIILGFQEECISWVALHVSHPILEHGVIINMICTNTELSIKAMACAYNLDVKRLDRLELDIYYPLIKCLYHSELGYIYVLPWDDIYDYVNTKIFIKTIKEAEHEYASVLDA